MKLLLPSAIFMHVFVLPWGLVAATSDSGTRLAIPVLAGNRALCGFFVVRTDISVATLRFFGIAELFGASFLIALVGGVTASVIAR